MPIAAQSLIRRVVENLQDNTSIRWPVSELVRYLNDGQREIVLYRPDAIRTTGAVSLVAGARQTLPVGATKLIEFWNNATGNKRAVRLVNREILDSQSPGWQNLAGVAEILHYTYDPRIPTEFFVYPPATIAASLVGAYSSMPAEVAEPADGVLYTAVSGSISVPDIYANTLQDYILYRAYDKDSEYAGNAARSQARYAAFANALGIEIKATVALAPVSPGNPNTARNGAPSA
ncbi:Phage protein [Polaromonas sp. CG9_12]|nr:Phage protein [Polaromonas sp. CG9_12]